ncbi:MAG: hypothetical protein J0I12_33870 [Candidatus Eremiobacteraeota bacterium]|nr:hypothetical protein [Candidatus Eremiobacteraeota bacterium]
MKLRVLLLFLLLLQAAWPQGRLDRATPFAVDAIRLGFARHQVFRALGAPSERTPPGLELTYQNETTTIGVFSRQSRVSVVGLSRRS